MNESDHIARPEPASSKSLARPLEELAVGISVSLGEDSSLHGFTEEEMNRSVVRISDALLSAGARLVFGHDWRPGGIMAAIGQLAVSYDPVVTATDQQDAPQPCRITNLVPWDQKPELPRDLREDLEQRRILRIEPVSLPAIVLEHQAELGRRAVQAAGLSILRERLAELCDARICIGGKFQKYQGFWPGIFEEAFVSATKDRGHQVLLSGIMGGAARRMLGAAHTGAWRDLLRPNPDDELRKGLESLSSMAPSLVPDLSRAPQVLSWGNLQRLSGLNDKDWETLAKATDVEVVAALAIKALQHRKSEIGPH